MATTYRPPHKDSLDDIDEKGYSEHSDDDESAPNHNANNNFMLQVQSQRRLSFSYSKQSENDNDSDDAALTPITHNMESSDLKHNPYLHAYDDSLHCKPLTPYNILHTRSHMSNHIRQPTELLMDPYASKPLKLERRHSADKVLSKPSTKATNSVDYLTRMVISLRSKIATYKEDLRIAGELGQKLFIENGKKQDEMEQYLTDIRTLNRKNDELTTTKRQLLQTTQIDAEHTKQLETDLHLQMSSSLHKTSKYEQECVHLREELQRTLDEMRQLQQLNDQQRIEIETLETRNEQIAVNAGETIDDLSEELAEEKDGHCILKHKYQKLRNECTKLKINYEKRGTEIQSLTKQIHAQDLKLLDPSGHHNANGVTNGDGRGKGATKHEVKLLYRQIDNFKDEMEGISKHLDLTKTYLKTMMNCLENSVLLMNEPDTDQIYALCTNARQFLGIEQPPPVPTPLHAPPPMMPQEHSPEPPPLPKEDADDDIPVAMPREPTPPALKVRAPLSVPALSPNNTTHSPPPPCMPSDDYLNHVPPPVPTTQPPPKSTINHEAMQLPPMNPPNMPQIPLPAPKSPPQAQSTVKLHHAGVMPSPTKSTTSPIAPSLPPSQPQAMIPSIPKEVIPKTKRFSSAARPPPSIPAPHAPDHTHRYEAPSPHAPTAKPMKCNTRSKPMAPPRKIQKEYKTPAIPSRRGTRVPSPHVPSPVISPPKVVSHHLGVMPVPIADEKPLSVPSVPHYDSRIAPSIPQDTTRHKVKVSASAMAPPPHYAPPVIPTPVVFHNAPTPHTEPKAKMESVQSTTQNHNEVKKKKKKKKKKKGDSMEDQKRHLTLFFSTYSDNKNWTEGKKENGIQKYILRFAEREPLNARMAFLYSMTLYLGQIVGVNKRCISHAFMLFKSVRAQIDTLCEEFALILQTLEHHNDDKLWKYVYSFLYNAAAYFKHIQRFVGTRTSVDNPRKYSRALKAGSRDFTYRRRESSFRKLSGLSEVSGQSIDYNGNDYRYSNRRVYGSAKSNLMRTNENNENNDANKMHKTIKVIRK